MNNFEVMLREHNLKATKQRIGILSIMEMRGHINIEELYEKIKKSFPSISLATLYKNMHLMLENKLLTEVGVKNSKTLYEITKEDHAHMHCEKCNEVVDIDFDFENITDNLDNKNGFILKDTQVIFSGICKSCK
ncbi:MAG: transcriptional repressor [Thiovulaceae bacterium]|nr:transcriptional repressor [Sulfurimonadaceae bacterium]MCW9025766.1 transcriptional repressor [Sulfurimonadaceae bacterium]